MAIEEPEFVMLGVIFHKNQMYDLRNLLSMLIVGKNTLTPDQKLLLEKILDSVEKTTYF